MPQLCGDLCFNVVAYVESYRGVGLGAVSANSPFRASIANPQFHLYLGGPSAPLSTQLPSDTYLGILLFS